MQVLEDTIIAIFNFKHIGRVLSKRPAGKVALSFISVVLIYTIVFGLWYSRIANDFVTITIDIAKPELPTFNIINGQLNMLSSEPYIITHELVYDIIKDAVVEVDKKHFDGKHIEEIQQSIDKEKDKPEQTFCLVMDTTGTYKGHVNLGDYSKYTVVTKDSIEAVDRVNTRPGDVSPISEKVKQDVRFSPDLADRLKSPATRILTMIIMIGLALYTPIHFLFKALVSIFVVWLILLIAKKEKPFDTLYKVALYALAPIVLLSIISSFWLPIHGLIMQAIYFACIVTAVIAIPKPENSSLQQ